MKDPRLARSWSFVLWGPWGTYVLDMVSWLKWERLREESIYLGPLSGRNLSVTVDGDSDANSLTGKLCQAGYVLQVA